MRSNVVALGIVTLTLAACGAPAPPPQDTSYAEGLPVAAPLAAATQVAAAPAASQQSTAAQPAAPLSPARQREQRMERVIALIQDGVPENELALRATDQGVSLDSQLPRRLSAPTRRARSGSKPPRVTPLGATILTGKYPPGVVERIVRQNLGRFRACYQKGLEKSPNLQGRVTVKFVIAVSYTHLTLPTIYSV